MNNKELNNKLDSIIIQNKMIQGYLQAVLVVSGVSIDKVNEIRENLVKEFNIKEV